jgi:competence protein ComEA
VVDVVGKVRRPGVYHLATGARVTDAIAAAGGAVHGTDLTPVNLARKVSDGEQIAVGVLGAASGAGGGVAGSTNGSGSAAGGSGAVASGTGTLVNLNSATPEQLDALPGVGPVLAQRIVDWRVQHGGFHTVDQLNSVSGIGDAIFARLRPLVTL